MASSEDTALEFHQFLLEDQKVKFSDDPNHPVIVNTLFNIAQCHKKNGNYKTSLAVAQEALAKQLVVLARQPTVGNTETYLGLANLIANCHATTSDYVEAVKMHRDCYDMLVNMYDGKTDKNQFVSIILNNMANCYRFMGQFQAAIDIYKESLEIREKLDKVSDHKAGIANIKNNLASCYRAHGDVPEALNMFEECLDVYKQVFGKDTFETHIEIPNVYSNIGICLTDLDQLEPAIHYLDISLKLYQKILAGNEAHPSIIRCKGSLADAYRHAHQVDKAIEMNRDTLSLMEKHMALNDINKSQHLASILNNLALCYSDNDEIDEALNIHSQCLIKRRDLFVDNPRHHEIAETLNNLGNCFVKKGHILKGIDCHKEALEIRQEAYKDNPYHKEILDSMCNLASCYHELREYGLSIPQYEQCLEKLKKNHSGHFHQICSISNLLAIDCILNDDYDKAFKTLASSNEILCELLDEHSVHQCYLQ